MAEREIGGERPEENECTGSGGCEKKDWRREKTGWRKWTHGFTALFRCLFTLGPGGMRGMVQKRPGLGFDVRAAVIYHCLVMFSCMKVFYIGLPSKSQVPQPCMLSTASAPQPSRHAALQMTPMECHIWCTVQGSCLIHAHQVGGKWACACDFARWKAGKNILKLFGNLKFIRQCIQEIVLVFIKHCLKS